MTKDQLIRKLRAVIKEAMRPGVFGDFGTVSDPSLERTNIERMCERHGYGAMMAHIQHLWSKRSESLGYPGSEHTVAACASVRRRWLEDAAAVLKEKVQ